VGGRITVAGNGVGTRKSLVGVREVEVTDVMVLADLQASPGVIEGRLGALDDGIYA
jgi:hypothetical protein